MLHAAFPELRDATNNRGARQQFYEESMGWIWDREHWWCHHGDLMRELLYVLNMPTAKEFSDKMGQQLNTCLHCVHDYHKGKAEMQQLFLKVQSWQQLRSSLHQVVVCADCSSVRPTTGATDPRSH